MSRKQHEEMLEKYRTEMTVSLKEMVNNEDLKSMKDVAVNDTFDEFTMIVD
ncbi:hypothetical protein [Filobacillus milosensis]|uniref:hypothetical protein n=1 Tax=Filobacillus milosensis TaxID=94137 RepID=UPI00129B3497|nr:hypothetical protein [Filobacillus milosensis]